MTLFLGVKILWKHTVSAEFRVNRPKLCGNCAFSQNFHTRKLGKITMVHAVTVQSNKKYERLKYDNITGMGP